MFSRKRQIAAHVANDIVYIMVVDKRKGLYEIKTLTQLPLDKENLFRFCANHELFNQPLALSIENKNIITQIMEFPLLPKNEIKKALVWEFVKNIPLNPEDIIVDYLIIEKTDSIIKLLVFAVQKYYVEKICDLFFYAGFKPKLVEIDGLVFPYLIKKTFPKQDLQSPSYILFKNEEKFILSFLFKNNINYLLTIYTKEDLLDKIKTLHTNISQKYQGGNPAVLYFLGKEIKYLSEIKKILQTNYVYQINKLPANFIGSEEIYNIDSNYFFPCGLILRM